MRDAPGEFSRGRNMKFGPRLGVIFRGTLQLQTRWNSGLEKDRLWKCDQGLAIQQRDIRPAQSLETEAKVCLKLRFTGNLEGTPQEGNILLLPGQVVIWELRSTLLTQGRCAKVKTRGVTWYETTWWLQKQNLTEAAGVLIRGNCPAEMLSNGVGYGHINTLDVETQAREARPSRTCGIITSGNYLTSVHTEGWENSRKGLTSIGSWAETTKKVH